MNRKWYKWPHGYFPPDPWTGDWAPWYIILWRALLFIPVMASVFLLMFFVFCAGGYGEAKDVWRKLM